MELKDFKEYAIKTLLEYEQLNNELRTLRETYIEALNIIEYFFVQIKRNL